MDREPPHEALLRARAHMAQLRAERDAIVSTPMRPDARQLQAGGFPMAMAKLYNVRAPQWESRGEKLRTATEMLEVYAICEKCDHDQFDGRQCKLCSNCMRGQASYLHAIATVGGKCLNKEKPLF